MKLMAVVLLSMFFVGFAPRPEAPRKVALNAVFNVDLNREFTVKKGAEVVVNGEKLRIKFDSVNSDSRCPTGVQCVWAGNAAVTIEVATKHKKPVKATLNTTSNPREIAYKAYKIKLIKLTPHPVHNQTIDPKNYEATLIVSKE